MDDSDGPINDLVSQERLPVVGGPFPKLIAAEGAPAAKRFLDFFMAEIANHNTRRAYAKAVVRFCSWCEDRELKLQRLEPFVIAQYIAELRKELSIPSVKQHLAAIRRLFDYLVTGHIVPHNPAAAVRGPRYSINKGKTPILTEDQVFQLISSVDTTKIAGLRDRALIAMLYYSFARIGAVLGDQHSPDRDRGMKVGDYFPRGKTWWFRLHEKGGKYLEVAAHHKAVECIDNYLEVAGIAEQKSTPLFRALDNKRQLTDRPLRPKKALAMIKRRARQAGLPFDICCHSWRGTGITHYLSHGGTIEKAQQIAGHESPRTTIPQPDRT